MEKYIDAKTIIWLKAAGVRAIKTMAQTAVAMIGTATIISSVDWKMVASASVVAGILSLLTSVTGIPEVDMQMEDIEDIDELEEEGDPE